MDQVRVRGKETGRRDGQSTRMEFGPVVAIRACAPPVIGHDAFQETPMVEDLPGHHEAPYPPVPKTASDIARFVKAVPSNHCPGYAAAPGPVLTGCLSTDIKRELTRPI